MKEEGETIITTVPSSATVEKGPSTDLHEGSVGWACTGEGLPGGRQAGSGTGGQRPLAPPHPPHHCPGPRCHAHR